jgi:hypothetical protein
MYGIEVNQNWMTCSTDLTDLHEILPVCSLKYAIQILKREGLFFSYPAPTRLGKKLDILV